MEKKKNITYEIYCLYHDKVFPKYYKDQLEEITFVKTEKGPYVFPAKKHIYLEKQDWFSPIGKEWAEYEFYYSLYQGYKKNLIELPDYVGFIHYDMKLHGKEKNHKNSSIIDFIDTLIEKNQLHEKTWISFQPLPYRQVYNQRFVMNRENPNILINLFYENCLISILRDCNIFLGQNRSIDSLKKSNLNLCGAFFMHKSIFLKMMEFLSTIIEDGRLSAFDKKERHQARMCERYVATFLEFLDIDKIEFDVHHDFITSNQRGIKYKLRLLSDFFSFM